MIEIRDITVRYQQKNVLEHFSAQIPLRGTTLLSGPSGCGKTTLLRAILGLTAVEQGDVCGMENIRPAVVFQEDRLIPWLTTLENAALVSDTETAANTLRLLGLTDAMHSRPAALSGGMKRRAAIARAIAFGGNLLVLDEPFNGLDEETLQATAKVLLDTHLPILLVTHHPQEAALMQVEHRIEILCNT